MGGRFGPLDQFSTRGQRVTFGRKMTTAGGGRKVAALAVAVAALVPMVDRAGAAIPGATVRVSVSSSGGQATEGGIPLPSISADGRYVAFGTRAAGLVPNDTNARDDIFVYDRQTATTSRVSVGPGGRQGNGGSFAADISADGRFVAFGSGASDLVPGDDNEDPPLPTTFLEAVGRDIFVHDRQTGVTERVSVASDGTQGRCFDATGEPVGCNTGVASNDPAISADGRYVAFSGGGQNLVPGDTNGQIDVFVHDRQTRQTTRVNLGQGSVQATGGASTDPAISADGRFVAFRSTATNLVPGDTNAIPDYFVHDRQSGTTERVSVASDGTQGVGGGTVAVPPPAISPDGRFVAFTSGSTNLVAGDTNGASDVFVHDRTTKETVRVSVGTGGAEGNGASAASSLAAGGRFVAFDSIASNLVPGDTNGASDVFVHDRQTGTTTRASLTADGAQAFGGSFFPALNSDGRFVAFSSESATLTPGDTNGAPDVFVHDRTLPAPAATGYRLAAADGGIFAFGDAGFFGSTGGTSLAQPITASATTPNGRGYWLAARDGGVFAFGAAGFFGSAASRRPPAPIVAMAATVGGQGYWLAGADGRVYDFGDAILRSPAAGLRLAAPIVGMAATPSGNGYWLVAADGGVFGFGDARFFGSTGNIRLAQPIVGMAATLSGRGYWLVAGDGGVFAFGDARFFGSTGAIRLAQPVVGMATNLSGRGYWLVARDGGVFAFGDARFFGSTGAIRLNQPIVAMTPA
jgi:Tol biopolymer transport system component